MYWGHFDISLVLCVARFDLKVASEEASGVLSQVKIFGPVKYIRGPASELQLLIIYDLSSKINIID